MRPRIADTLREMGYTGDVDEFRRALAEVKAEAYPQFSIDELCFTRDEAADFCQQVRKRLAAPRLTRVLILRSLTGLRKNPPKAGAKPAVVAQSSDGQATA